MAKKKKSLRKSSPNGRNPNVPAIRRTIQELFEAQGDNSLSVKQIFAKAGIRDKNSRRETMTFLLELEHEGLLKQLRNGHFVNTDPASAAASSGLVGRIDHVNKRFAYVVLDNDTDEEIDDVWVKSEDLMNAIDGDRVEIKFKRGASRGSKPEGKVIKIIERARNEFVGKIEVLPKYAFVVPDNRKIYVDIFVYPEKIGKAKTDDKVLVKIKEWHGGKAKNPVGLVTKVLGKAGENEAEIHSIMAEFELPFEFPKNVEKAAEAIDTEITKEEIQKRKDFRDITTFTIDPDDAKDFDDAISIQKLKNGNHEIGVHIADVSHYVQPGSTLDEEAVNRATSVYLVDRTIPMLPEKLSNGVCSLRPYEEKLTFSAVFEIDDNANIKKKWFGRTVTYSDRRFTYEEAQERIESGEGDFHEEINLLNGLAKKFKKKRFDKGAINFETVEVKFKLDENGKPLGIIPKERKDAHKLVEEFMLLANKHVAEYVFNLNGGKDTFVYRTHDNPNPDKLESFTKFAVKFGHKVTGINHDVSSALNKLMDDIQGKPEQNVLESLAIRSMSKAVYITDPKGHFGLAFDHYTHFTSPIRRYPDVMVHRLLQHYLSKKKSPKAEEYKEICRHTSEREKRASDAERASIKFKQVEFMQSVENKPFEGVISGVTEFGIFVEITETKCEGMVRAASMTDDFYEFDEKNYCMIGKRNKRVFTLGDKVTVMVVATDINRRTIDLEFVELDD
ncbi:ribonuclease R [Reichenbachiella sp. MSK19-1]|uniref:ribonuclease R n=1 Tax=Reichenbachiella sp. MSK19-1 TaxID=1897631 RepID=UPI000E6CAA84|nr:ribonuclease R [Reichenbachiella sp. MSK19-1]RJE71681.1 ribonuclease R [Reichenbachiella sp. MSK19-1]